MKTIAIAGLMIGASLVVGCGNAPMRVEDAPRTAPPNAPGLTPEAKDAAKQGMDNASIMQKIQRDHRLPNGQPLPGPGQPPPQSLGGG